MKKLSELSTPEFSRVLCTISGPANRLFSDPEVMDLFEQVRGLLQETKNVPVAFIVRMAATVAPVLLGEKHQEDTYVIAAAIKGVTVDDIRQQPGMQTMLDIWHILTGDKDLTTFFRPVPVARPGEGKGDAVPVRPAADD